MRILMLGWEYSPKISGGLGVASQEFAEALAQAGHEVTFLLPKKHATQVSKSVRLLDASTLKPDAQLWKKEKKHIETFQEVEIGHYLLPYLPPQVFEIVKERQQVITTLEETEEYRLVDEIKLTGTYQGDLMLEITKYALLAAQVAKQGQYDIVHAHDWTTFKAGLMVKKMCGIPLGVHVHSTEYDRNGSNAYPPIVGEEQTGFNAADFIFCVSNRLKHTVETQYKIKGSKIFVAPNALNIKSNSRVSNHTRIVAFAGRFTHQKSPQVFIDLARDLISRGNDFQFQMIGDGYMMNDLKDRVHQLNLGNQVKFLGFLERGKLLKKLSQIDLLVIPSASEPFGLVALEAILNKIPVAAARGIGLTEFIPSIPQVDAWNQFEYVKVVERLMNDDTYRQQIIGACYEEAKQLSWKQTVKAVVSAYDQKTALQAV